MSMNSAAINTNGNCNYVRKDIHGRFCYNSQKIKSGRGKSEKD